MQVLLTLRQDPKGMETIPMQQRLPLLEQYKNVHQYLAESGRLVASSGLTPEGRTLRKGQTDYVVTEGPYGTGNEMLNGFFLFDADSLDEAEQIARGLPTGEGNIIELRPLARQL